MQQWKRTIRNNKKLNNRRNWKNGRRMPLTMRMNSDQDERARTLVAVLSGAVAPARPGALCAALARPENIIPHHIGKRWNKP